MQVALEMLGVIPTASINAKKKMRYKVLFLKNNISHKAGFMICLVKVGGSESGGGEGKEFWGERG